MFEPNEKKTYKATIRFTDTEKKAIENYMKENNFKNFSDFIRHLISNQLKK